MLSCAAEARLRQAERAENFPVALRLLPSPVRAHLRAVYDVVRVIDDLGDEADRGPDRAAAPVRRRPRAGLDRRAPGHRCCAGWSPTVKACDLPRDPFNRLVAANLQDQEVTRYETWTTCSGTAGCRPPRSAGSCSAVFGVDARPADSSSASPTAVCIALQLLEHWQDVAEDRRAGPHLPARRRPRSRPGCAEARPRRGRRVACAAQADRLRDGPGRRSCSTAVRSLVAPAARLGALRRRRLRRRRPRGGRRAAPTGAGTSWPGRPRPGAATSPGTCARPGCSGACGDAGSAHRSPPRTRPARTSPGTRPATSTTASGCCRRRSARRCARSTPSPGGSTTSATATCPPGGKAAALAEVRDSLTRPPDAGRPGARGRHRCRAPLPDPAWRRSTSCSTGVEMDVEMDTRAREYRTFDDLVGYCRCVAGSVGRLCLGVFGSPPGPAGGPVRRHPRHRPAADQHPARHPRGPGQRPGLPARARSSAASASRSRWTAQGALRDPDGGLARLIGFFAERARTWYADGLRLVPLLDRRSAACTTAMAGIYRRLLDDIAADPPSVYDQRLSLSGWQKAGVAARALAGLAPSGPAPEVRRRERAGGRRRRRAGRHRGGAALRRRRVRGDPAGVAHPAGRARRIVPPRERWRSTRLSTCSCAAAPPTGRCWTGSGSASLVTAAAAARHPGPAPGRRPARLRRGVLPAPLHLAGSLLRYHPLPPADRLRIARGRARRCAASTRPTPPPTGAASATGWREHGQGRRAVDALWDLIGVATLNAPAGARLAGAGRDGVPARPAHRRRPPATSAGRGSRSAAARRGRRGGAGRRRRRGAHRDTGPRARQDGAGWRVAGERRGRPDELVADRVVCALPPDAARHLLPARRSTTRRVGGRWAAHRSSTCTCVYDRRVLRPSRSPPAVDTPVQWVFDRTAASGPDPRGPAVPSTSPSRSPPPTPDRPRRWRGSASELLPALAGPAAARAAGRPARLLRDPGAACDVPAGARNGARCDRAPAPQRPAVPRRRLDRHRVAGDDGRCGAQRRRRRPTRCSEPMPAAREQGGGRRDRRGGARPPSRRCRDLVAPALRAAVERLDPASREQAAYHLGWSSRRTGAAGAGCGKAVRPALALLSAQAAGAGADVGLPGAVAVELVHNFSLAARRPHGRRHRAPPPPHGLGAVGPAAAILTGDAMLALASEVLARSAVAARAGRRRRLLARDRPRAGPRPGRGRGVRGPGTA